MGLILVVMENGASGFTDASRELLGKARELTKHQDGQVMAVGFGPQSEKALRRLAVDRVICADSALLASYNPAAYEACLDQIIKANAPCITLIANTTLGIDLGAGVASRCNLPLIAYCTDLQINGNKITATSQIFAGKAVAEIRIPDSGAIVTVLPGVWNADTDVGDPDFETWPVDTPQMMEVLKVIEPETGDVDITKADILVSVGRGIESPENLPLAEDLATSMGGVVSCSRPVVDAGWLPKARQVGKSGQTVKPKLYLALGISGAPEHLQGMRDADLIIAVNTDENASIMDVAHYGTTVDMLELMPALAQRLRGE